MRFMRLLPILGLAASTATAQIISIPGLDLSLLEDGALINLDLTANLLGGGDCNGATVGVYTALLGLIRACVCVNILQPGAGEAACPACPSGASPVCGSAKCACACPSGTYATPDACVPNTNCPAPNVLVNNGQYSTCQCASGFVSDGAEGCVAVGPSARARSRHRRALNAMPHGQDVFAPKSSGGRAANACPRGETACPTASGGFECIDTSSSLTSCGGCPGAGGENCLAIPGALAIQCLDSQCHVGSCFKGWRHSKERNGRCA
ncbi:uncharacterized protein RHOBADRAFT_53896 [Rhodotorula graminis WP1]|uniref:Protein CPL1-like domain-containing protein n=1 Tax=Rhodotorula graminis (strain WP1) TaxID=578459 RepID=A0A194S6E1_RHOGW|nr:uncharacterized protein RHOBADRAFT_53896 [Rhodotorula graminis WP1]KPV74981.1 hypothetical protein RHOBADRAFT_53896 [Rhodotorula graminis WP1]